MRVIWFAGWYPTNVNPHGGNFIRRHLWAMTAQKAPSDELKLLHLAPYYWRETKPKKLNDACAQSLDEWIIAVPQFKILGKALNILIYYLYAFRAFARLQPSSIDVLHVHAADKIGWLAAWFKFSLNYRLYLTEHWAIFNQPVPDAFDQRGIWFKSNYRFLWKSTNMFARINHDLFQNMVRTFESVIPTIDFPNVLDPAMQKSIEIQSNRKWDSIEKEYHFLHISNGDRRKNIIPLLEAFSELLHIHPTAELTLIGTDKSSFVQAVKNVHWKGVLPSEDLVQFYQNASALILVSDAENAPCVLIEAHCFGLPTIVTQVGGIPEMCTEMNAIQIPAFQTHEEKAEKIFKALLEFIYKKSKFDSLQIQQTALAKYQGNKVAAKLWNSYRNQICVV